MVSAVAPEIELLKARLDQFERDVQEVEDSTGHPFKRGRAIIEHYSKQLAALDGRALQ